MGSADVDGLSAWGVTGTNVMASPTPEQLRSLAAGSWQVVQARALERVGSRVHTA